MKRIGSPGKVAINAEGKTSRVQVRLDLISWQKAAIIGGGNVSDGIRQAVKAYKPPKQKVSI